MYNGSQAIAASGLSYTYIGCPLIKEEEKEGDYHVFEVLPKNPQWVVKAGHIADFIEGEVRHPKWERKIIGIANLWNDLAFNYVEILIIKYIFYLSLEGQK